MAELVLTLHLLFILFILIGFPAGLITNHRGFRIFHCGALMFITLLMILGIPCPLTFIEEGFRNGSYEGSFIATWLNRIIYMEWFEPRHVFYADLCFAVLVVSSFWWRPLKKKPGTPDE
ncbi:MAG: DUF2784 family protein [Nitrospinaceae bacterium]